MDKQDNNKNERSDQLILAIESSCDDTSAAVLRGLQLLSNVTANQDVHAKYGGVVPEWASRAHQRNIVPVVHEALKRAGVEKEEIEALAFTRGPGLLGSLLVGTSFAKSFAQAADIPLLEVNHMKAHILAHFIQDEDQKTPPEFPFICLTVSGGHTQLVLLESPDQMRVIGETLDDAAGEAFDKAAKLLGMPYPGGPLVDKLAKEGDANRFQFTISDVPELNYSFSGLKTNLLQFLQREVKANSAFVEENLKDICASFQKAIIESLMLKLVRALDEHPVKGLALAGGVSANSGLRATVAKLGEERGLRVHIPRISYCTDNAAMIGAAGYFQLQNGQLATLDLAPKARWKVGY